MKLVIETSAEAKIRHKNKHFDVGLLYFNTVVNKGNINDYLQDEYVDSNIIQFKPSEHGAIHGTLKFQWSMVSKHNQFFDSLVKLFKGEPKEYFGTLNIDPIFITTKEQADSYTDWSGSINFTISPSVKFVDVSFYSLDILISELGGTLVIMQSIFIIAITLLLNRKWKKSLVKEVS